MTGVATSANLNDIQETNILVSSINKDDSKKENFDQLDDDMVYIINDKVLDNSPMKRYWVIFLKYKLNYLNRSIISVYCTDNCFIDCGWN